MDVPVEFREEAWGEPRLLQTSSTEAKEGKSVSGPWDSGSSDLILIIEFRCW
jgi:hypothetical protein